MPSEGLGFQAVPVSVQHDTVRKSLHSAVGREVQRPQRPDLEPAETKVRDVADRNPRWQCEAGRLEQDLERWLSVSRSVDAMVHAHEPSSLEHAVGDARLSRLRGGEGDTAEGLGELAHPRIVTPRMAGPRRR